MKKVDVNCMIESKFCVFKGKLGVRMCLRCDGWEGCRAIVCLGMLVEFATVQRQ
jgi:hypothetical protein